MKANAENAVNWKEKYKELEVSSAHKLAELEASFSSATKELERRIAELEALNKYYEEQFRLAKHRQFGQSSEKSEYGEQLGLFDEAENTASLKKVEELETISWERTKRTSKIKDDLSDAPLETVELTLAEEEQICPVCGGAMHELSTEECCHVEIIPAKVLMKRHLRHVYACRNCEKTGEQATIVRAPMPEPVIKGSLASPSAIAHIAVQKYVNAVPLYRQEQEFLRQGLTLSRQTMANWLIKGSQDWLEPLYERMRQLLLSEDVLHGDESVLQVLKEPGKKAKTDSYMWLYRTGKYARHPIVLYEYQPTRSSSHPKRFLGGYKGYLHTDGYAGYHKLAPDVTVVGCWAHLRRKFDEALKALPEKDRPNAAAMHGFALCNRLFALESEWTELSPEQRLNKRQNEAKSLAEEFFFWARSVNALPKSALGKAVHYAFEQQPWLMNVFLDGRLELSNNRAERSIKPFVIGRKNWLFCNSQKGARSSSVIYSMIETAKENGLKPFEYLAYIFAKLPNSTTSAIDRCLPWSEDLPDYIKAGKI